MNYKDYYKVLGVEKNATIAEIKTAFKKLAKKYHPDANKNNDADAKFKEINEAYEVLKDTEKRAKYDNLGSSWNKHTSQGGNPDDFNWNDWASKQQSRGRRAGQSAGDYFDNSGGISDFFEKIFGGGFSSGGARPRANAIKGEDITTDLELSLEEAYNGVTKQLLLNKEKLEMKIKPGIANEQVLKLTGKGTAGKNGGKNGDLIITIKITEHNLYDRKGNDLYLDAYIDIYTLMLGGESKISTFGGTLKINISPESQSGKVLKLKGQGMPIYGKENERGDLYIKLIAKLPINLTDIEKELIAQLKEISKNKN